MPCPSRGGSERQSGLSVCPSVRLSGRWFDVAVVNVTVVCLSVRLSVVRRGGSERQGGLSVRLSVCLSGRWFDVAVVNVTVVCLSVCPSVCLVGGSTWR